MTFLNILILVSVYHLALSNSGDLAWSAQFPPTVSSEDGQPKGHLKPFGCQRESEGKLKGDIYFSSQLWA